MIVGRMIGGNTVTPRNYIIQTEDGQEFNAVLVDSKQVFTATADDIRKDKVAVTDNGVVTGQKVIPAYHTYQGFRAITAGSALTIPNIDPNIDMYDYTKLQAIICKFNTTLSNSVESEHVCIDNNVYPVQSVESASTIVKNHDSKTIELGIINDSDTMKIIRCFMYKEIE